MNRIQLETVINSQNWVYNQTIVDAAFNRDFRIRYSTVGSKTKQNNQ